MKSLRALAGGLLGILVFGLVACGGMGKPSPEQIAKICEENADRIERIRELVERRGKSVLERLRKRARGRGVQFIIEHCLEREPDVPELNPSEVDQTVATSTFDSTRFLYTGEDSVQTGVDSGTIELKRAAVIRGRVFDENGDPLSGATVRILNHPEFGQTVSREDGFYDMAVNGGKQLTVDITSDNHLPVQRPIEVPWRDIVRAEPAHLVTVDTASTDVDLTEDQTIQVHEANATSDSDGTRQARLFFKPKTEGILVNTDGSTDTVSSINVRATEFTVGPNGPERMPGPLPSNTLYTYASGLTVNQVLEDTTVQRIRFSRPVSFYVDNFLSFPVGSPVPSGLYNTAEGRWEPADSAARVIQVLSETDNQAQLDVDGDGEADTPAQLASLGITPQEQTTIANQFDAGDSFWRAPIQHFSTLDLNHGSAFPGFDPNIFAPLIPGWGPVCDGCNKGSNTINLHNQTLGEQVDVVGTPFSLNYQSNRTRGFRAPYTMNVNLSNETIPEDLRGISMEIRIAGRIIDRVFDPEPNLDFQFKWDGEDVYGRTVQSPKDAQVTITYLFPGAYRIGERGRNGFGNVGGVPVTTEEARENVPVVEVFNQSMGTYQARAQKLGGWTLDVHHMYDPENNVLYRGDGEQREAEASNNIHKLVAGLGDGLEGETGPALDAQLERPKQLTLASDGTLFFTDRRAEKLYKIDPDGILHVLVDGMTGTDMSMGPNEDFLYIARAFRSVVVKVNLDDGTVSRAAGTGESGFNGDGIPATEAQLRRPMGIDVDPQGNLYIADKQDHRIRKVDARGIITTVAGTGELGHRHFPPNGSIATEQKLHHLDDVEIHPNGEIYYARSGEGLDDYIRKITNSGRIQTVFHQFRHFQPKSLDFTSDGTLFWIQGREKKNFIRKITPDGSVVNVAGAVGRNGRSGFSKDGTPALRGKLPGLFRKQMALSPEGEPYYTNLRGQRIMKIAPSFPDVSLDEKIVPSEDGSRIFVFSNRGRHLRTVEARTGTTLFSFEYNSTGLLTGVTDRDGQTTTIERDSGGQATAIVSPFGQRTELTTNSNGFLTQVTNPASEAHQMTYADSGLLRSFTDPRGNQTTFDYSDSGRLVRETDPRGGFTELARSFSDTFFEVQTTTAEGRTRSFRVIRNTEGDQFRKNVGTDDLPIIHDRKADATRNIQRPDGTRMATVLGPDPRFNMQSPITEGQMITTPGGRDLSITQSSSATEGDSLAVASAMDTVSINGRKFVQRYDGSTRTVTNISPEGRVTTTKLNEQARVARIDQGDLLPTSFSYNDQGQLAQTIQGDRTSKFAYNAEGFLSEVTDPIGRTTRFAYDAAGRIITQTLPDGRQIGFQYDDNGNLTALTPPGRGAHVFRYTSRDETQEYEPPSLPSGSTITTWTYNLDRQLTQIERPDLSTVNFGYDGAGRLSTLDFPADRRTLIYSPSTGNLTDIQASNGVDLSFTYDGSLPTRVQWDGPDVNGSLVLTYDDNFRVTDQTINGSTNVSFSYDRDGLLTEAGDLTLNRDSQTGLLSGSFLGDVQTSWSHNDFGELVSRSTDHLGSALYTTSIQRDTAGRIVGLSEDASGEAPRSRSFDYDEAGRLVRVNRGSGETVAYDYDSNGNRVARTGAGVDQTDFTYDAQDRLLSYRKNGDTMVEFGYTPNGELQSKIVGSQPATTYDYDALGNLRSVTLKGDTTIDYVIDGQNRRVGKKVNGQFKQGFIYQDQLNPVAELDENGDVESVFIYGAKANVPSYMIKNGTKYRIVSNHLGSVRLVVNTSSGNVVQRMEYDAFGRVLEDSNPGFQPFGFAGGLYAYQTGLVRFGERDYDPRVGRWPTKDPLLFGSGSSNLYGYVVNDPVNLIDQNGRDFIEVEGAAIFGGGITTSFIYTEEGQEYFQIGFGSGVDLGATAAVSRDEFNPSPSFTGSVSRYWTTASASSPIKKFFGVIDPNIEAELDDLTEQAGAASARLGGSGRSEFTFQTDLPGSFSSLSSWLTNWLEQGDLPPDNQQSVSNTCP